MRAGAFPSPAPRPAGSRACAHDAWKVNTASRRNALVFLPDARAPPPRGRGPFDINAARTGDTTVERPPRRTNDRSLPHNATIPCETVSTAFFIALSKHGDEPHLTLQICALPNCEPPPSVFLALPPRPLPSPLTCSDPRLPPGMGNAMAARSSSRQQTTAQPTPTRGLNGEDAAWKGNYRIQTQKRARESTKGQGRPRTGEKGEGKGFLYSFSALTRVAPHPVAADPGHPTLSLDPPCILHPSPFPPPRTCNVSKSSRPTMASFMMSAE